MGNNKGIVLFCAGGETFGAVYLLMLIFGLTPVLAGLLFIALSKWLSRGTVALLSIITGKEYPPTAFMVFYIVFGILLILVGPMGLVFSFTLGC